MLFFLISSKFQIYDYAPNPNVPLSDSEGKVDIFPAGGDKISLDVPSDTTGRVASIVAHHDELLTQ